MIFAATKAIEAAMKAKELKYSIRESEKTSAVRVGFDRDGFSAAFHFISSDDDTDVAVRILDLVTIPEPKRASILTTLNELNNEYRYLKFCLDGDGDVRVEYDFPVSTPMDQVGAFAYEVLARGVKICDDAYPRLMKAIWA